MFFFNSHKKCEKIKLKKNEKLKLCFHSKYFLQNTDDTGTINIKSPQF